MPRAGGERAKGDRDHAADAALDVVEAQKLKALGIRNSIEAEIGAVAAAPASAAACQLPPLHGT
jgi:hypothetical protein